MIRQAISCDVCGAEKKQTNHWYVASDQGGELRVSGWSSRNRLRSGTKHLCGQTCLHKLVDEFISRSLEGRSPSVDASETESRFEPKFSGTDTSLTSKSAYRELNSSAKTFVPPPASALPQRILAPAPAAVVAMPARLLADPPRPIVAEPVVEPSPNFASSHWRAEAWERERKREMRTDSSSRRRKSS